MTRFLLLIALAALGGCATTSSDYYRDGRYYGDAGYSDGYYSDDGYYADRYYDGGYAGGDYYYGEYHGGGYYGSGYGYASDYLMWPEYYSIFWPINHWYVDPYYYPGYYYGVTYFPRDYWSLSLTWGNRYSHGWGYYYGGYQAYSPYRYSWADNYYDWYPWHHQHSGHRDRHDERPRYGSARNEAERVMALREQERMQMGSAAYRNAGVRTTSPDRRGPRGAYYPSEQSANAANVSRNASSSVDRNRVARDELVRNAEYRRTMSNAKPARDIRIDRSANTSLERTGVRSYSRPTTTQRDAKPASSQSDMLDAAQEVRRYRRAVPDHESQTPGRLRYSSSAQAPRPSQQNASPIRQQSVTRSRDAGTPTTRSNFYRSPPLPATRTGSVRREATYAAPSREVDGSRYSRPAPAMDVQRQYSAPARSVDSYRAPPRVESRPAPVERSAPSNDGRSASSSSSSGKKSSGSSSSRVRSARSSRSGDD